ncbi:MAG TPA: thioredoxin-dependent thiol peroxidase [Candidatus Marinimicrobia bacterium]|nr:MAG: peroxiredoxin [Candidatus Marinimicrobia bacterium CG1_02_48_14]PJA54000.1 MAG: thioredoxin-dependent thiol peroxidase [Candidatus Marinimicrobia bacterium CG_4_9_14_3_um_filter_48_9]HCW75458.1 thioredoxin-dependent thiol peroxidase [Candidatus Neomarinimicrobiota bacterium]
MLTEGQTAPLFTLNNQAGHPVSLEKLKGKKVVLYFYPKDDTPGCTKQACNLRDNQSLLTQKGVVVLGISTDSEKSHQKFSDKYQLNFDILADPDKDVVNMYGVWGEKSLYGRKYMGTNRWSFLINETGVIDKIYTKVKVTQHSEDIIKDWGL